MADPHFYLKDKKNLDKTLVSLYWRIGKRRFVYSTGIKIRPSLWSLKKECVLSRHPDADSFNSKLERIKAASLSEFESLSLKKDFVKFSDLKEAIDIRTGIKKDRSSFFDYFDLFSSNKMQSSKFENISIEPYNSAIYNFRLFANAKKLKDVDFVDFNYSLWIEFEEFLLSRNLSNNYANKMLSKTISILRQADRDGFNNNKTYQNFEISIGTEETTAIYLNEKELRDFYEFDFSDNLRLEKARDIFVAGSLTGLRYSDYHKIKEDNIRLIDGFSFLRVLLQKSKNEVIIPIDKTLKEIISKYGGSLPVISDQKLNNYLKEIGSAVGFLDKPIDAIITRGGKKTSTKKKKFELLSTHTARRSFATNAYLSGWDTLSIRMITGHSNDKQLFRYIRVTKEENALRIAKANQTREIQKRKSAVDSLRWVCDHLELSENELNVINSIKSRL